MLIMAYSVSSMLNSCYTFFYLYFILQTSDWWFSEIAEEDVNHIACTINCPPTQPKTLEEKIFKNTVLMGACILEIKKRTDSCAVIVFDRVRASRVKWGGICAEEDFKVALFLIDSQERERTRSFLYISISIW